MSMRGVHTRRPDGRRWYCNPPGPGLRKDYPRTPRPAGGFTRRLFTCPRCAAPTPLFHVQVLGSCHRCGYRPEAQL